MHSFFVSMVSVLTLSVALSEPQLKIFAPLPFGPLVTNDKIPIVANNQLKSAEVNPKSINVLNGSNGSTASVNISSDQPIIAETNSQVIAKDGPKADPKSNLKVDVKPEVKTEVKTDLKSGPNSDTKTGENVDKLLNTGSVPPVNDTMSEGMSKLAANESLIASNSANNSNTGLASSQAVDQNQSFPLVLGSVGEKSWQLTLEGSKTVRLDPKRELSVSDLKGNSSDSVESLLQVNGSSISTIGSTRIPVKIVRRRRRLRTNRKHR